MKIGTHATESLEEIIKRKKREIDDVGFAMWGYGGNTCHPSRVRTYAAEHTERGHVVRLCMQPMKSNHFAVPIRADMFSEDNRRWQVIPEPINVLGSKFALCIDGLEEVDENISLGNTIVALGDSKGRKGSDYIRGRVDKACLEVVGASRSPGDIPIRLVANLVEPFAVFLHSPASVQPRVES